MPCSLPTTFQTDAMLSGGGNPPSSVVVQMGSPILLIRSVCCCERNRGDSGLFRSAAFQHRREADALDILVGHESEKHRNVPFIAKLTRKLPGTLPVRRIEPLRFKARDSLSPQICGCIKQPKRRTGIRRISRDAQRPPLRPYAEIILEEKPDIPDLQLHDWHEQFFRGRRSLHQVRSDHLGLLNFILVHQPLKDFYVIPPPFSVFALLRGIVAADPAMKVSWC